MKTKVFHGNQYIGKINVTGNKETFMRKMARRFKKALIVAAISQVTIWAGIGLYQYGKLQAPVIVKAQEVIREIPILDSPVLARIAVCESGGKHYDGTGQVLIKINTNGTVDIGKFQINSVWKKTATKLGLDLTKEKDNEEFAQWLYLNKGTQDWYASAKCWNK